MLNRRLLILLGISTIIGFLVIYKYSWSLIMTPELWLYDFRYQMSSMTVKEKTGPPDICYIAIDKPSRDYFEKNYGVKWPWPRTYYTELLKKLKEIKPSVVAFDIMFFKDKPEEDGEFSAAIKESGNVIVGSSYTYSPDKDTKELKGPNETIKNSVSGVGFLNIVPEPDSIREKTSATREFARRISLIQKDTNQLHYHFALQVARCFMGLKNEDIKITDGKFVKMGSFIMPVKTDENHLLINYMWRERNRQIDTKKSYDKLSFQDAMDIDKLGFYVERGSIVLIGYDSSKDSETDTRLDVFLNPGMRVPRGEGELQIPGASVLIYSIRTILGSTYISQASTVINSIVILIFGWISSLIFLRFSSWKALLATVSLVLVCFIINCSLFLFGGIWIYLFHPFIVITLNFIIVTIYEVQRSRNIFAHFLPKAVVEKVLADHKALELGGEKKEVTIIFSDIRGYTDLSETLEPDQVLNFLNVFNVAMGDIIKGNKGTIFDYQGDAIMAVFGAPEEDPEHAYHAVKAALGMQEKMKELADGWEKEGKPHVEIGIGVSTGIVAIGMMGTSERRQYVAIGDSTNVSARVQGKSKELESPVLITETTYEQAKNRIIAEPIGKPIEVKGKSKPLNLYRVTGINS